MSAWLDQPGLNLISSILEEDETFILNLNNPLIRDLFDRLYSIGDLLDYADPEEEPATLEALREIKEKVFEAGWALFNLMK